MRHGVGARREPLGEHAILAAKRLGFSDQMIGSLSGKPRVEVRDLRKRFGIQPHLAQIDTMAAEFPAETNYLYSSYHASATDVQPSWRKKILVLGSGAYRIGSSVEFDWCGVNAIRTAAELGYETMMLNYNPETVSTDYDTSDRLYFEPLTEEDVLNIVEREQPMGVVLQFGGQTPLKLALSLSRAGVNILGTSPDAIDRAEDRARFRELLDKLGLRQAESGMAHSVEEALTIAAAITYPVMVRPSYVLGGRSMQIVYDEAGLLRSVAVAPHARSRGLGELLTRSCILYAREAGLESLWLLTTTAPAFFLRLGFTVIDRAAAPLRCRCRSR